MDQTIASALDFGYPVLVAKDRHQTSINENSSSIPDLLTVALPALGAQPFHYGRARNAVVNWVNQQWPDGRWLLWIDSDEYIEEIGDPSTLSAALGRADTGSAFAIEVRDEIGSNWIGRLHHSTTFWRGHVHEYIDSTVMGEFARIQSTVRHSGYTGDQGATLLKFERYLRFTLLELSKDPRNPRWLFFAIRDGQFFLSSEELEELGKRLISTWNEPDFDAYFGGETRTAFTFRGFEIVCQSLGERGRHDLVKRFAQTGCTVPVIEFVATYFHCAATIDSGTTLSKAQIDGLESACQDNPREPYVQELLALLQQQGVDSK